jgi:hypothetical protein
MFFCKNSLLPVFIYVGAVDYSKIQVRPAYESRMEDFITIGAFEYAGNRSDNFIKTKSLAFLKHNNIFAARKSI